MNKFSTRLVNYVEPVIFNGLIKTAFYTEFNTNFEVGDKVFIINGNYDSNAIIQDETYVSQTTGYTVLEIDRCRITLDIDWTGALPYYDYNSDEYIKIYSVTSQRDIDYFDKITVNTYNQLTNKFEYGLSNNMIYSSISFTHSSISYSPGFYQKSTIGNYWQSLSILGTSSIYFKTTGFSPTYSLTNNGKLLVIGENINVGSKILEEKAVYTFDEMKLSWEIDAISKKPLISKLNFRNGLFSGDWNDGIFGSYDNTISWYNGNWNSGIMINSIFKSGIINSKSDTNLTIANNVNKSLYNPTFEVATTDDFEILKYSSSTFSRALTYNSPIKVSDSTTVQSFYCSLDKNGMPIQSTDFSNNKNHGFNYIIDTSVDSGFIKNGNFENCNIGLTNFTPITGAETRPYGINAIDLYYLENPTFDYKLKIQSGNFRFCDIDTVAFKNSTLTDCRIKNSNINISNLYSNQIENSVVSGYYENIGINILNADLWSYYDGTNLKGILKLFITDEDLIRIKKYDTIHIDRINKELYLKSFNDENKAYINLENKYIFDLYTQNDLASGTILVSFKNKNENTYKTYVDNSTGTYQNIFDSNSSNYASIDIDLGTDLGWYKTTTSGITTYTYTNQLITPNTVSDLFSNTFICNSNFSSGILVDSTWKSGAHINDIGNKFKIIGNNLSISIPLGSTNSLYIDISNDTYNSYDKIKLLEIIYLQGIDYVDPYGTISDISGVYQVISEETPILSNSRRFMIYDYSNNINTSSSVLGSLIPGGIFTINNCNPNYISINKSKIEKSNIESGLFKTSLILNSYIYNESFNNSDNSLTISNISKLRFVNLLLKKDNNIFNSGLIYKSHIIDTNWTNAIAFNSIFNGTTFSNGVFKNGYWLNGYFSNGLFTDSDDTITSNPSYDNNTSLYYRSWRNGTFNSGQFFNSVWIDGLFNNGRLFNSHWYSGTWSYGILGLKNSPYANTTMAYKANLGTASNITNWYDGVVESAIIGGLSNIYWYNGKFNDGQFTSFASQSESIWYNGEFNGGRFEGSAKWKYGTFNKGKFLSYYGWTMSGSTNSIDYSWEGGRFNSGQFGQQSYGTNSTWYTGEFNNGYFYGRVWNSGVFHGGIFNGGVTLSTISNEIDFVNSFTNSYYGLWRDGWFVETISSGKPEQLVYTELKRTSQTKTQAIAATIQNALWLNGTFSHGLGTMLNSSWLSGKFLKGTFKNSSFNPYVDSTLSGATPSFNLDPQTYWKNGTLENSNFYISVWNDGIFKSGFMQGAIWKKGTWFYGTADNIYWKSGTWKNGNWYGSNFDYLSVTSSLAITDEKTKSILYNIASASNNLNIHILNAFTGSSIERFYDTSFNYTAIGDYNGWTNSTTQPYPVTTVSGSDWTFDTIYNIYSRTFSGLWSYTTIFNNNYKLVSSTDASKFLYGYATYSGGFTTSIFNQQKSYTLTANLYVNIDTDLFPTTNIEMWMGSTYSLHTITRRGYTTLTKTYTDDEVYFWTQGLLKNKFAIKKRSSSNAVDVIILDLSAKQVNINYNKTYNNKLYQIYGSTPSISATISLPGLTLLNESDVSVRFGNGKFLSGVWENGIWNNGYRNDETIIICDLYPVASYIKMSKISHRIQLQILDTTITNSIAVGDYVSIGNIIGIDVNGDRKILNDKFRAIYVGLDTMVLEYTLNTPILQITKDSDEHLIYVSKNVWLSGGFLSGYFKGIWNYGLFKGYPYTTEMYDTQWINGIFDGGHFNSSVSSSTYSLYSSNVSYNTGLVQNFTFKDNNISGTASKYLYQSWMDINYLTYSMTNINQEKTIYESSMRSSFSKVNLNGYITNDVLSSKSTFRNGYDLNTKIYNFC